MDPVHLGDDDQPRSEAPTITPQHIRVVLNDHDRTMEQLYALDDSTSALMCNIDPATIEDPVDFLDGYDVLRTTDKTDARKRLYHYTRPQLVTLVERVKHGQLSIEAAVLQASLHSYAVAQVSSLPGMERGSLDDVWAAKSYRQQDIQAGRIIDATCPFVDAQWARDWIKNKGTACFHCGRQMLTTQYAAFDKRQMTADRIDNALPHYVDNCVAACLCCNLKGNRHVHNGNRPTQKPSKLKSPRDVGTRPPSTTERFNVGAFSYPPSCTRRAFGQDRFGGDIRLHPYMSLVRLCPKCRKTGVQGCAGKHRGCGGSVHTVCAVCLISPTRHLNGDVHGCNRILEWSAIPRKDRSEVAVALLGVIQAAIRHDVTFDGEVPVAHIRAALQRTMKTPDNGYCQQSWWKETTVNDVVQTTLVNIRVDINNRPPTTAELLVPVVPLAAFENMTSAFPELDGAIQMAPPPPRAATQPIKSENVSTGDPFYRSASPYVDEEEPNESVAPTETMVSLYTPGAAAAVPLDNEPSAKRQRVECATVAPADSDLVFGMIH